MSGSVTIAFDPASVWRGCASDSVGCTPVRTDVARAPVARALKSLDPVTAQAATEFWRRRIVRPAWLLRAIVTGPAAAPRRPKAILNGLRGETLAATFRLSFLVAICKRLPFLRRSARTAGRDTTRHLPPRALVPVQKGRVSPGFRLQSLIGPVPEPTICPSNQRVQVHCGSRCAGSTDGPRHLH